LASGAGAGPDGSKNRMPLQRAEGGRWGKPFSSGVGAETGSCRRRAGPGWSAKKGARGRTKSSRIVAMTPLRLHDSRFEPPAWRMATSQALHHCSQRKRLRTGDWLVGSKAADEEKCWPIWRLESEAALAVDEGDFARALGTIEGPRSMRNC